MRAARVALATTAAMTLSAVVTHAATNAPTGSGGASLLGATTVTTATTTTTVTRAATSRLTTTTSPPSSGGAGLYPEQTTTQSQTAVTSTATTSAATTTTQTSTPPAALARNGGVPLAGGSPADQSGYSVAWNCPAACRVAARSGPSSASRVVSHIAGGDAVTILCQADGSVVRSGGASSSIWDRLSNGEWLSDLFVTTPTHDARTPGLPSCLVATLG